jgi:hypothetical protein
MWVRFCHFWRSLFRPAPLPASESRENSSPLEVETAQEILRTLHGKRDRLRQTMATYRDFGYDDLATRCREEMFSLDRRILELRLCHHAQP